MAKLIFEKSWATVLFCYYIALILIYIIHSRNKSLQNSELNYMTTFYILRAISGSTHFIIFLTTSDTAKTITLVIDFLSISLLLLAALDISSQL